MKIEMIKRTQLDGTIIYSTRIDDRFIDGSVSLNEKEATEIYNRIISGEFEKIEIIKTTEL
jgi:hypothetical protein